MDRPIQHQDLAPKFVQSLNRVLRRTGALQSVDKGLIRPEEWDAVRPYFGFQWFRVRRNVAASVAFLVAFFGSALVLAVGVEQALGPNWSMLALVMWSLFSVIAWSAFVFQTARTVQAGTLTKMLPLASFETADERTYAEAVAAIVDSPSVPDEVRRPLVHALNAIVLRIRELEARLLKISRGTSLVDLERERDRVLDQQALASDVAARQEYSRALATIGNRIEKASALTPEYERIQAGLENLRQSLLAARDLALQVRPESKYLAMDAAEASEVLNREIDAVNRAIQEVVSLTG